MTKVIKVAESRAVAYIVKKYSKRNLKKNKMNNSLHINDYLNMCKTKQDRNKADLDQLDVWQCYSRKRKRKKQPAKNVPLTIKPRQTRINIKKATKKKVVVVKKHVAVDNKK